VGRATLHRHFKSRDDLVDTLAHAALDATDAACADINYFGQSASVSLRETIEALVPLGATYAFLAYQPISEAQDTPLGERLRAQSEQMRVLVEAAQNDGMFSKDIPLAWLVTSIDALIYAGWDAVRRGDIAPNDVARLTLRTLERGLGTLETE